MFNVYFIAGHGENFRRLPEFLATPGLHITLICCNTSLLRKSDFVDEVVAISQHPHCNNFAQNLISNNDLLSKIDGWVVFASDDDLYRVANSDLDHSLKLKLLPVRNPEYFKILGSKKGFVEACKDANVPTPKSKIAMNSEQLRTIFGSFPGPVVFKSDQGSSGAGVHVLTSASDLDVLSLSSDSFPLVVQEYVAGAPIGVDVLFREGHLLAWMYSGFFEFTSEFGPTISRRYISPPSLDFVESLQKFGRQTGAHGFANCSFFYLPEEDRHLVFEIDLRTNAWHHFGPMLGLNWVEMISAPINKFDGKVQSPRQLPPAGLHLTHWQRNIEFAISARRWRDVAKLLRSPKRERFPIPYKDSGLNRAQIRELYQLAIVAGAQSLFELLPANIRRNLKKTGATARFASKVASR